MEITESIIQRFEKLAYLIICFPQRLNSVALILNLIQNGMLSMQEKISGLVGKFFPEKTEVCKLKLLFNL